MVLWACVCVCMCIGVYVCVCLCVWMCVISLGGWNCSWWSGQCVQFSFFLSTASAKSLCSPLVPLPFGGERCLLVWGGCAHYWRGSVGHRATAFLVWRVKPTVRCPRHVCLLPLGLSTRAPSHLQAVSTLVQLIFLTCPRSSLESHCTLWVHLLVCPWPHWLLDWNIPWWLSGERICLLTLEMQVNPWVGKMLWRRKWQPTPVFLPGTSHGQRCLVGYIVHGVAKSRTQLSN